MEKRKIRWSKEAVAVIRANTLGGDEPWKEAPAIEERIRVGCGEAEERQLRDRLVEINRPLAIHVASRYAFIVFDQVGLLGDAFLGLAIAGQRWEAHRGAKFASYAFRCVRSAINAGMRDLASAPKRRCRPFQHSTPDPEMLARFGTVPGRVIASSVRQRIECDGRYALVDDHEQVASWLRRLPEDYRSLAEQVWGIKGPEKSMAEIAREQQVTRQAVEQKLRRVESRLLWMAR